MNRIKVLFFATLRQRAGLQYTFIEIDNGTSIQDLKNLLNRQIPSLEPVLETSLASINREFALKEDLIPPEAEVAFFPPVSGGVEPPTFCAITEDQLDLNKVLAQITLPTTGASCIFTGMVRAVTRRYDPHDTIFLEYEAYLPMAEAKMRQVADEIRARWPDVEGIAIIQRVGRLMPGTPTIMIACTAPHRDTGVFEAARYGIDRLKEIVPVWKKEVGPTGEVWVEGEYIPDRGDR